MTLTEIKTAALGNVIRIHGNQEDIQNQTEVIDLNIKTNFTVSNSTGSKIVQKLFFVLVLFLTGTFAILHFNVRREIQALKSQEQSLEDKILLLMIKYAKVNDQFNRFRSHHRYYQPLTTSDKYERDAVTSVTSASEDEGVEGYNNFLKIGELNTFQNDEGNSTLSRGTQENSSFVESGDFGDQKNDSTLNFIEDETENYGNRFTRTIPNTLDQNDQVSVRPAFTDAGPISYRSEQNDQIMNDEKNDDSIELWSESRTPRMRRDDERRGKIRTKNKRRPNRSRRRLGPLVATFIGGIPDQHITDRGTIGPWVKLTKNTSHYDLQKFHLVDDKKAIEVTMNGLYMISAQMYYFGANEQTSYSYWILLTSEGQSRTQRVIKCSAVSSAAANEVSCHTNVVLPLRRGDRLHIQQQERDRLINLREGHSYIQLVLLSNESQRKH